MQVLLSGALIGSCGMVPGGLRVNNLVDPLGVPLDAPIHFSWALRDTSTPPRNGQAQTAYQIVCSSSPGGTGDVWDSGRVPSAETLQVPYGGAALRPSQVAPHHRPHGCDGG